MDIVSDHKLVPVLDELGERKHLRAPTVDGHPRVFCSLANGRDIVCRGQITHKDLVAG